MNDTDLRDLLARVADEVPATPVDPEPLLRRGYRRIARTAVAGAVGIACAIVVAVGGVGLIRSSAPTPADQGRRTEPPLSGGMWPQSSLEEVRQATARFRDVHVALAEGYMRDPFNMCDTADMMGRDASLGAMGIHYFRADLLGVTRVTINRALMRLQRDGLIIVGRGRVDIVAPELLELRARG